jgi:hypothetical protein
MNLITTQLNAVRPRKILERRMETNINKGTSND